MKSMEPVEPDPEGQVPLDFSAFDEAVEDPDGEPMGVVLVDGDYRPDLSDGTSSTDPGPTAPVPDPPRPTE
ncbi:hypothetical protein RKD27_007498 [Streptomyces sp. SAI-126]|uniref:hypothetical protein n=1 Tax=Streptomyces sp. SAI-126 TaxID=3377732 RepID=UPI000FA00CE1